jgi:cob(I)alamin adenosyltransferase
MKIYTRTGDGGETGLVDGSRVRKDHARVVAFGDVDELNAFLGAARALAEPALSQLLDAVQRDLFAIGAQVADPRARVASRQEKAALPPARIVDLEKAIDAREAQMPPLTAFILPGGTPLAAALHVARTVCRRAERSVLTLGRTDPVDPLILVYLNRLSDLLFVLARHDNHTAGDEVVTSQR